MEIFNNLFFWLFSGIIPAFIGINLMYMSESESIKRSEIVFGSLVGLIPIFGHLIGIGMLFYGTWLHIYKDRKDWWEHAE